jgi:hypothetical protein
MKKLFLMFCLLIACKCNTPSPQPSPITPPPNVYDSVSMDSTVDICVKAQSNLASLQCPNRVEPEAGFIGSSNLLSQSWVSYCEASFTQISQGTAIIAVSPLHPVCLSTAKDCAAVEACVQASQ